MRSWIPEVMAVVDGVFGCFVTPHLLLGLVSVDALTLTTPGCSWFKRGHASLARWWPGTAFVGVVMNVYRNVLVVRPCSRHWRCC